jgi:hypothetical protein
MVFPVDQHAWDIKGRGRTVRLIRKTGTPDDPSAPWEGGTTAPDEQDITCKVKAFRSTDIDGDRIREGDQIGQILPGDLTGREPVIGDRVLDGGTLFTVQGVTRKAPGDTVLRIDLHLRA